MRRVQRVLARLLLPVLLGLGACASPAPDPAIRTASCRGDSLDLMPFQDAQGQALSETTPDAVVTVGNLATPGAQSRFQRQSRVQLRRRLLESLRAGGCFAEVRDLAVGSAPLATDRLTLRLDRNFGVRTPNGYRVDLAGWVFIDRADGRRAARAPFRARGVDLNSLPAAHRAATREVLAAIGAFLEGR